MKDNSLGLLLWIVAVAHSTPYQVQELLGDPWYHPATNQIILIKGSGSATTQQPQISQDCLAEPIPD